MWLNHPTTSDHSQTATNNAQPPPQVPHLDANQLKLFQQLTQTVNSSEITTPITQTSLSPPSAPTTASSDNVAGPSYSHTYWNHNSRNALDKSWEAGHQVGRSFPTSPPVEENDHHGHRGRFRGGYRGRGRGRFGDRDREGYRDRFYDSARSPGAAHGRRSRSRSPPRSRYGGGSWRDVKPYSPPHRPSIADQTDHDIEPSSSRPGVDEFGREIRPSSDDEASEAPDDPKQRPTPPQPLATHLPPTSAPAVEGAPVPGEHVFSASAAPQATPAAGSNALHQDRETPGLESFDYSTFDPTSPTSWEALGRAWAVTNGRQPSQEELMMFAMEVTVNMANQAPVSGPAPGMQGNQRQGGWMDDFRGGPPRGGRGKGAFGARGRRR